jgi:multicomponent Na+:H+ antiporter subunit B
VSNPTDQRPGREPEEQGRGIHQAAQHPGNAPAAIKPGNEPAARRRIRSHLFGRRIADEDKAADDRRRFKLPDNFNDVYLHTASTVLVFLIMAYAIYILFAGHNNPGGGFVGGLVIATGLVLLYLAFDSKTVRQILPINFRFIGAAGVLIAVLTGAVPAFFGQPFLTQSMFHLELPMFGEVHLATAVLFDIGVFLAVIGTAMTIISSISEDG